MIFESQLVQIESLLLKSNHQKRFNCDLNQIAIWICSPLVIATTDNKEETGIGGGILLVKLEICGYLGDQTCYMNVTLHTSCVESCLIYSSETADESEAWSRVK